jgi:N6-L-threonylcarbamoyladenine synthase
MIVLGVESSCDETAAAVLGIDGILSEITWSQDVHEAYGGVVPELASRAHIDKVVACVHAALDAASVEKPDAVAATAGPGLIGAVLVGFCFSKALSAGWSVPFVGVNHLEGHLLSPLLEKPAPDFPFLSLVVSGGHTTLYLARGLGDYKILGQTVDDAAGEAFDKVARMMGAGYPGGPVIDSLAESYTGTEIRFPRPRVRTDALDMSFSGLKTAVRQYLQKTDGWDERAVASGFQSAVVDVLMDRIGAAVQQTGVRRVAIGGGVAANEGLRSALRESGYEVFLPPRKHCTDNAAMIANAGRLHLLHGYQDPLDMTVRAQWPIGR